MDNFTSTLLDVHAEIKRSAAKNSVLAMFLDNHDVMDNTTTALIDGMFDICHTIAREHGEENVPADWNFNLGAGALEDDLSIFEMDIQYLPLSNLLDAGAILSKSLKELDKLESN